MADITGLPAGFATGRAGDSIGHEAGDYSPSYYLSLCLPRHDPVGGDLSYLRAVIGSIPPLKVSADIIPLGKILLRDR
jgi:hypothetical protein